MDDNQRMEMYRADAFKKRRMRRRQHRIQQLADDDDAQHERPLDDFPQDDFSQDDFSQDDDVEPERTREPPRRRADFPNSRNRPTPQRAETNRPQRRKGGHTPSEDDDLVIFVSVPSYRDSEVSNTLADLFRKARFSDRIRVGVYEQNYPEDASCMAFRGSNKFRDQIEILTVSAEDARGPMVARAVIERDILPVFRDEVDYILNIDSHTLFSPEWDVQAIAQLKSCASEKALLTMYPAEYKRDNRKISKNENPSYLTFVDFHPKLLFPQQKRRNFVRRPVEPMRSLFWAAGFSFAPISVVDEVPYDPNCPFVFLGEEASMAARLFTHGWDTYCPTTMLVHHLWDRSYRPVFWEQVYRKNCKVDEETRLERKAEESDAVARLQGLIWAGDIDDEKYGLGDTRTLDDWKDYTGVDLVHLEYVDRALTGLSPDAPADEWICKLGKQPPRTSRRPPARNTPAKRAPRGPGAARSQNRMNPGLQTQVDMDRQRMSKAQTRGPPSTGQTASHQGPQRKTSRPRRSVGSRGSQNNPGSRAAVGRGPALRQEAVAARRSR